MPLANDGVCDEVTEQKGAKPGHRSLLEGVASIGGTLLHRTSDSKTTLDKRADRAIEFARNMPPGLARNDALKKAGLLRLMADLAHKIAAKEKPVRGKKPHRVKFKDLAKSHSL